jgi:hypothetical protein
MTTNDSPEHYLTAQLNNEESPEAVKAAEFANTFLMHRHRGVINCDSYFVIFGNDGYSTNQASRIEAADVWGALRQYEMQFGLSSDGTTWAIVLTDHSRTLFDEDELEALLWNTWMTVYSQFSDRDQRLASSSDNTWMSN